MKISVITPTLNQGKYIRDTIESVLSQDYSNIEHIIIDGGSTDDTLKILGEYSHLIWISEPDNGAANAINKGFKIAKGDLITWLNSDDYYYPNILSKINNIFYHNPSTEFIYGNITFVDNEKNIISKKKTHEYDLDYLIYKSADIIRQPCTFFGKKLFNTVGGLDENFKCAFDYDLFIKMIKNVKPFYIDEDIAFVRDYNDTISRKFRSLQGKEIIKIAKKNGAKNYNKIVWSNFFNKIFLG
jgi:glycosyltransferase involved in cell wall biosynthesis